MSSPDTVGRVPIQIVEIQQPFCEHTFGSAPCAASGTADTKCYNTRATCQDPDNFSLGTPLSLYFSRGRGIECALDCTPYVIPSLVSVSTSPTRVNLARSNPDAKGLGNRALCTITFQDHQHTDRLVDPYVDGRSWNPLSRERGSFWSRWLVRNKYRQNLKIIVYEGYEGQAVADMVKRTFFLDSVSGPDGRGIVTIKGKDILSRLEERKAQVPVASPGELFRPVSDTDTSFEIANAVEADYPASGTLLVGDELMTYTGRATSTNGIEITGVTRGTDNTTATEHDQETLVQTCWRVEDEAVTDVLEELLVDYSGIDSSFINSTQWAEEADDFLTPYRLTTLVTKPTSVFELVSQIQEQCQIYIWWDERDADIKLRKIRGVEDVPDTLTEESHIIADSFSLTEKPRERVSQVWVYYDRRNYTSTVDDPNSYDKLHVNANLTSEGDALYGEPSIRKIFAQFLTTQILAQTTASTIITRYVDTPSECRFRLDAKDRTYWVGDSVYISHHLDVDQYGNRRLRQWTIISAEEVVPGELVEYVAEDTTLYGKVHYVMSNAAADYPGAASAPFKNCYIGDADGLLSDGSDCGRIS